MTTLRTLLLCLWAVAAGISQATAQSPFDTVAQVNDGAITRFDVDQRALLLQALRSGDSGRQAVLEGLIDDRLRLDAAEAAGVSLTEAELDDEVESFAARGNLSAADFLARLQRAGVAEESLRQYIEVRVVWRDLIQARYTDRARPSDAQVDQAMASSSSGGGAQVLVSEIILPLSPQTAARSERRARAISQIADVGRFSRAARRFSAAPTASFGGRTEWRPLTEFPPRLQQAFLSLSPGQVSDPFPIGNGIALFQLRALRDDAPSLSGDANFDYVRIGVPAGEDAVTLAERVRAEVDGCDDVYGLFPGAAQSQVNRQTAPSTQMPEALASTMRRLDTGEVAALPDGRTVVKLCERAPLGGSDTARDDVAQRLFTDRLETFGQSYLAELRAEAFIERNM